VPTMMSSMRSTPRRKTIPDGDSSDPLVELFGDFPDRLRGHHWQPVVDIFETSHSIVVRVEIPGVAGEDIHVNIDTDLLRVSGVRKPPAGGDIGRLLQMEIAVGPFERRVQISTPFDRNGVSARLEDGILSVNLPKKSSRAREVKVETE